jgi:V/A-type H+-transporting ATPase subunit I
MLRPEQMSKVSVTGSKRVMDDVVEAVHDMHLLHVTEYDGSWEGFQQGTPTEGAEDASDKLVTVRAIESILDLDESDAGRRRSIEDEDLADRIEEVRTEVNELDDRRESIRDDLRDVEEQLDTLEPFARLGIDLELLSGYRTLEVAVGEGKADAVERALVDAPGIDVHEVMEGEGDILAVFARPTDDEAEGVLADALVGTNFTALEVPDAEGSPEAYTEDLRERRRKLETRLDTVESEIQELKVDAAGFLLAAEEQLSIQVQKTEAPLTFATTENAFVAEGWIPTERYTEFARAVQDAVGDHAEVEEVERAQFTSSGHEAVREEVPPEAPATPTSADGGTEDARADGGTDRAATDGGAVVMRNDDPPVVQDNPGYVSPFEVLVRAVGTPKYSEFDPTVILFLTFPAFFGFMIGDFGYGAIYTAIGYFIYTNFDSDAFRSMGGVTIAAGLFTMLFGVLYGEIFGLHQLGELIWGGHPPMEKGLSPAGKGYALTWLVISILLGILHLNVGFLFSFVEDYQLHDLKEAVLESGSWLLMLNGFWVWILSRHLAALKPAFLFTVFDGTGASPESGAEFVEATYAVGFNGFPVEIGFLGLGAFVVGLALIWASGAIGEAIEALFLQVLVNGLSYTRIAAVLLAKAGMAFTVNLLFFGAYEHDGEFHFLIDHGPEWVVGEYGAEAILFPGMIHGGVAFLVLGLVVLVLGHLLVLALGVTSAGLQAVRLEYVEFFGKFFDGGGREYDPFGHERRFTDD